MSRSFPLRLTPELVARAHRVVPNVPLPHIAPRTEEDHKADVEEILSTRPPGDDLWLFAYGSLLWKPAFDHAEEVPAVASGWHRAFCMRIRTFRGTPEQPGLMMALDRGGKCRAVAVKLSRADLESQVDRLVRREMPVKRADGVPVHTARWIRVQIGERPAWALSYVINRKGPSYAGRMTLAEVADVLSSSCGYAGSCAEYLHQTVIQLQARGIHDSRLWRLQELVAERLEQMHGLDQTAETFGAAAR
jgi:cation transport protein ChaC